ncbi:putative laccase [Dendrothele bispora CBS 962.96]|uniref:laccase n=1 Tax=Dendrothele bispora (strain CBS 962.96) TaxID=1314807 RepID=A0A4S8M178_DENBC|nr:putative laccase [Dendrothele bispora CBS 962.96]
MVIYDPDDPYADSYDVDDERALLSHLQWYHDKAETLKFPLKVDLRSSPDATLINALGRFDGGNAIDLAVINVEQGKKYRMRLVNLAQCDPEYTFSIDNHTMTIIEVDGVNHEQLRVDQIQIFVGQRYSFILNADQAADNYWIRVSPSTGTSGFTGGINSAILRYSRTDEDSEPGTPEADTTNILVEGDLVPLGNPGAPGHPEVGGVDYALNLDLSFDGGALAFEINGEQFVPSTVPVLLQILSGAQTADSLLPSGSVYSLPSNSTIEISIPAGVVGGPVCF